MKEDLPKHVQLAISEVQVIETRRKDDDGVELINRNIKFKTIDKKGAMETMARIERWMANRELQISLQIGADVLIKASAKRVELLKVEDIIDGEFTHVENEGG
jgi:hypothetical protein